MLHSGSCRRNMTSLSSFRTERSSHRGRSHAVASAGRESGFTLIELTVVLAVIVTLALVLTPAITNVITESRVARAQADTSTLNAAIVGFWKDNGFYPQWHTANAGGPGLPANKVDLLVSTGNVPA